MGPGPVTLFLCGDVMTGRGVDQVLPYPGDPRLWETYVRDARTYVELAEAVNGPISRPVDVAWPWGDALRVLEEVAPDARVINLETSVTRSDDAAPGKSVHYRMSPANVACVSAARPDVCVLANNHVLDFGVRGLRETLRSLRAAAIPVAGAGPDGEAAARPAVVAVAGGPRVVVLACADESSGVPPWWAAGRDRPGVELLPDLSARTADAVADRLRPGKRRGDVAVASVHWGSNWGYEVPEEQVAFAHRLIDGGVDLVHGHSSHHPRPFEVYRGRLILYGCGDLIDDYEGISGYEEYRDDLRLMYFPSVDPGTGELTGLAMIPMQAHRLRLRRASRADAAWLRTTLNRVSGRLGARVELDGTTLRLR